MSLLLLHIILRFLVIRRGDALLYRTVPYRTGTVQPPYCPYCTVRYGTGTVPYGTIPYGTGTVPVRRYSRLNLYSDPIPLVNMCLVKKHLPYYHEGYWGGGDGFLNTVRYPFS